MQEIEILIKAAGIPENNAHACLYTGLVQDLASELVNLVRLIHSSVCGLGNVPWRQTFQQMLAAQEAMDKLDKALVAMVTPEGNDDGPGD